MSHDSQATGGQAASSSSGGHTLTKLGVRVQKSLTNSGGDVPTIRYDVTSGRDEPVVVHLIDVLPADIPAEAIGFHPEYGKEHWEAANGRVEYRRRLEPRETIVTVCGVRLPEEMGEQVLLDEPILRVETVDMLDDESDVDTTQSDDVTEPDPESRTETGRPTSDGGSTTTKAATRDHATATGANFGPSAEESTASTRDRTSTVSGYQSTPRDGSVAAALAADLRAGRVSEADRETLQDALDLDPDLGSDAMVDRLRESIKQERANLESELETLEKAIYRLYEQTTINGRNIETIKKILRKLDDGKADVEALETVREELAELEGDAMTEEDLERLRGVLTELKDAKTEAERLAEVETDLARLHSAIPNQERLDRIEDGLAELRSASTTKSDLDTLRSELQALEQSAVTTADLADLADRSADKSELDHVKSAVEELEERIVDAAEIEAKIDRFDGQSMGSADPGSVRRELEELRSTVEEIDEHAADRENVEELYEYVSELETEGGLDRSEIIEMMENLQQTMPSSEEIDRLHERIDRLESETARMDDVRRLERRLNDQSTPTTDGGHVASSVSATNHHEGHTDTAEQPAEPMGSAAKTTFNIGGGGDSDTALTDTETLTLIGGLLTTAAGLFFGAVQGDVQIGFAGFAAGAILLTGWALYRSD